MMKADAARVVKTIFSDTALLESNGLIVFSQHINSIESVDINKTEKQTVIKSLSRVVVIEGNLITVYEGSNHQFKTPYQVSRSVASRFHNIVVKGAKANGVKINAFQRVVL